jgi:ribosome maturation factor RimP
MNPLEKVREIVELPLKELGYDIADITFEKEDAYDGRNGLVVYITSPNGITIEDCVKASKKIKPLIDEANPIKEDYIFEVSSTATISEN